MDQLEGIKFYYSFASTLMTNLKRVWSVKGNYWDAMKGVESPVTD